MQENQGFRMRTRPSRISCSPRSILALNSSVNSSSSSTIFASQSSNASFSSLLNCLTCSSTCWSVGMEELKRKRLALQALLETTETRSALVSLRPLHVFAGAGIDFDPFAGLDEERRLDGDAGLQNDRLLDIVGGVPADSVRGIGDLQNNAGRQFN